MQSKLTAGAFLLTLTLALPVVAHHMAEGIVDEEIYEMIDAMVADTPHGDMTFEDLGGGMTEIGIVTRVPDLERMVADGLMDYVAMLDGDVIMTIDFTDNRDIAIEIVQIEEPGMDTVDKAAADTESRTLGEVKAEYR
jgi:hypothetical protein